MSVPLSLLAILDEEPTYGLDLKKEFEARTGGVWPLNVGQVYTTLSRLERDGMVRVGRDEGDESQKVYRITRAGRARLKRWLSRPTEPRRPGRDELVLKLVTAAARGEAAQVIQAERKGALRSLQGFTRLKHDASGDADLGWMFLLDAMIFQTEARVRWLDACEARLGKAKAPARGKRAAAPERSEVSR